MIWGVRTAPPPPGFVSTSHMQGRLCPPEDPAFPRAKESSSAGSQSENELIVANVEDILSRFKLNSWLLAAFAHPGSISMDCSVLHISDANRRLMRAELGSVHPMQW